MTPGSPAAAGRPVVGVLALQGDVREHVAALESAGALAVPVRRPGELASVDGILLPGGESTTIGKLLAVFDLLEPLRAAVAAGLPAYGSCAGMILLAARVLDGRSDQPLVGGMDVVVRRNAFGRQVDSFEGVVEINGLGAGLDPGPMPAVFIRAPVVESIGADVEVLGRVCHNREKPDPYGDGERVGRIVAIRQGNLLATAFHPELTGDLRVHRLFVGMINQARQGAGWNGAGSDEEQR